MNKDFKEVMSKRTDEELIKIVTIEKDDYQPLAVEAAEEEIKIRGIDNKKVEQVKSDFKAKLEEQNAFDSKKVSSVTRLIHFIVDTIAFFILSYALGYVLELFITSKDQAVNQLIGFLLLMTGFFTYYIVMENKFQKTLGKFITKTKVLKKNGEKAELGEIVTRSICRLIPLDRLSFLFTQNGFHDRFSDTTVVKDDN